MAGLVDAPWDNAKTSASNDDDLFERIGAMSIKDLKKFLGERNVTPDASIVEKRELRNLAYQSAGVGPPAKPLPAGWAKFVDPSDGTPYYHCRATGETSWDFPEAPAAEAPAAAAEAPADAEAPAAAAPEVAPEAAAEEDAPEEEAKPDEVDWKTLSIKELKLVLHANGLSTKGFAEKNDFVKLATDNASWIQPHLAYQPARGPRRHHREARRRCPRRRRRLADRRLRHEARQLHPRGRLHHQQGGQSVQRQG